MQMIQLILSVQLIDPMGTFGNGRYGKSIGAMLQLVLVVCWCNWYKSCTGGTIGIFCAVFAMVAELVQLVVQHWYTDRRQTRSNRSRANFLDATATPSPSMITMMAMMTILMTLMTAMVTISNPTLSR